MPGRQRWHCPTNSLPAPWPWRRPASDRAALPILPRSAAAELRRSRPVAAVQRVPGGRPASVGGAALSVARLRLRELPAGAARGIRDGGEHLHRLPVLLVVLRNLVAPRRG